MKMSAKHLGLIAICTLITLSASTPAWGEIVVTNIYSDLVASLQTDKSIYTTGENVLLTYEVYNPSDSPVEFTHYSGAAFFAYAFLGQEEVWYFPKAATANIWTEIFQPHETTVRHFAWDLDHEDYPPIGPGQYTLFASVHGSTAIGQGTVASTVITIVPEPATLMLLGSASLGLLLKRRRRN